MHEHDRLVMDTTGDVGGQVGPHSDGRSPGVDRPQDLLEPEATGDIDDCGLVAPGAVAYTLPPRAHESLGGGELMMDGRRREEREIGVGPRMVPDGMPCEPQFGGALTVAAKEVPRTKNVAGTCSRARILSRRGSFMEFGPVVEGEVHDLGRRLRRGFLVSARRSGHRQRQHDREYRGKHCRTPFAHTSKCRTHVVANGLSGARLWTGSRLGCMPDFRYVDMLPKGEDETPTD